VFDAGDISVDVDATVNVEQATFDLGGLITINTNPYTFAASVIITVLVSLWNASKERELLEEQIRLLKEIDGKIDQLNSKADAILKKLNALPAILLPAIRDIVHDEVKMGRIDGYYNNLDSISLQFATLKDFHVNATIWAEAKSSFYGICNDEFRYDKLLLLPKYTELMNFISAGREAHYFSAAVVKASDNVERIQTALAEQLAKFYKERVQDVANLANTFYPLRSHITEWPGVTINFPTSTPALRIGATTKALNDVFVQDPLPEAEFYSAYYSSGFQADDGTEYPNPRDWEKRAVDSANAIGGTDPRYSRFLAVTQIKSSVWQEYQTKYSILLTRLKAFHEEHYPKIEEGFKHLQEWQELKKTLRTGAAIKYADELKKSRYYIK
jgi:hypothetical protein